MATSHLQAVISITDSRLDGTSHSTHLKSLTTFACTQSGGCWNVPLEVYGVQEACRILCASDQIIGDWSLVEGVRNLVSARCAIGSRG